jgi:hypothetical protein
MRAQEIANFLVGEFKLVNGEKIVRVIPLAEVERFIAENQYGCHS